MLSGKQKDTEGRRSLTRGPFLLCEQSSYILDCRSATQGCLPLSGGHACSAPLVAETDKQALTQNLKKKKKKNKQTKTAAAVKAPSGPGNAEEAQQIRSIMGDHLMLTSSILEDTGVAA